jgi:uncharacterized membrane protein YeiH
MTSMYFVEMLGTTVFAMTGVLAVSRRGLDLVGAIMLGLVTAVGGGTVRDVLMRYPIFWFQDFSYVWAALVGALAAFFLTAMVQNLQRTLLYLDALGAALFTIAAANKALLDPGFSAPVAVILGLLTGIGGGLIRDVLAGRPTLLMSREIYATPIVIGCTVFVLLREFVPDFRHAGGVGASVIFGVRALAIWHRLEMPVWLVKRD